MSPAAVALMCGWWPPGCVGSGEGVPAGDPNDTTAPQTTAEILALLDGRCAQQCHRGGAAPKGLSFEPNRALKALVGVASTEVPGLLRVEPGRPERSYLIAKVRPTDGRRVGSRMPRGGPTYLSGAQIRALEAWIAAGAAPDWVAHAAPTPTTVSGRTRRGDAGTRTPDVESPPEESLP